MKISELIKLLEADRWSQVGMRGSHTQFRYPIKRGTDAVAGHPGTEVPPGTLPSALEQAGLEREGS